MRLYPQGILVACFLGHFFLLFAICCRDTLSVVARGYTFLPDFVNAYSQKAETIISNGLGEGLASSNPIRQAITIYTHASGIEAGYGFFAPNVPDNYKLVFEIHYVDGRVEYELPRARSVAAGLRLSTLIDNIGETRYDELREVMVKMMAYSIWREHRDATLIRAVLGLVLLPTPGEFQRGTKESYEFTYAYDFRFSSSSGPAEKP
jgi:hypothetical protein